MGGRGLEAGLGKHGPILAAVSQSGYPEGGAKAIPDGAVPDVLQTIRQPVLRIPAAIALIERSSGSSHSLRASSLGSLR